MKTYAGIGARDTPAEILDVMEKGDEKLGVNDAFSFIDWLHDYLSDIVYGD